MSAPLPTKRDEAWRYSDLAAAESAWPLPAAESIVVAANQNFNRHIINVADVEDVVVRTLDITLEAGSRGRVQLLNAGGRLGRFVLNVTLHEHSDFYFHAVQIGSGSQTLEIVTHIRHIEPDAMSHQTVRTIVAGKATGTYLGKVAVAKDAQRTDSLQSVKAMLLDRTATANAKPELEIYADDVKCAHGCAIGELDAMGLFYLESRGLAPAEAKKLMLQAFVAGVFEGASEEEALTAAALKKLGELV